MHNIKSLFSITIIVFIAIIFFSPLLVEASDNKGYVIAFAQDTMSNDFRKAQVFEVRDAVAKHPELSFVYSDADGQISLMIRQIGKYIRARVDLLIVGTSDENAVVPIITEAHNAGIPVIILDRGVNTRNYTTFINSDNVKIGALAANYIAEKLNGKGLVLLFEGLQQADVTRLRSKGFLDVMAQHPGIKIIKRTGNYLRKDALLEMEKLIKDGITVDAIFAESDSMLSGVRMVLDRYKINPSSIVMIGCDYTSEAQNAIRNNSQTGSVLYPLGGNMSIEVALKILAGEPVPRHISIPVKLVTSENVEQVKPIF